MWCEFTSSTALVSDCVNKDEFKLAPDMEFDAHELSNNVCAIVRTCD